MTSKGIVLPNPILITTASTIPTPGDEYRIGDDLFYVRCVVSCGDSYYVCIQCEKPTCLKQPKFLEHEDKISVTDFVQNWDFGDNIHTAGEISPHKWDPKTVVIPLKKANVYGVVNTKEVKGKAFQMDSPSEFVSLLECNPNRAFLVKQTHNGVVSVAGVCCIID